MSPLLVDTREAARLLGIGRTKIYGLIGDGAITPVHIGRCVRFAVSELERFVASGCAVDADVSAQSGISKTAPRPRSPRRPALREVTPRLFDPAS